MERFFLYDFSGNQVWQKNRPLSSISFENVTAQNVKMPLNAYGDTEHPIMLTMQNCYISFEEPIPSAIRAAYYGTIALSNVAFKNVTGALVTSFGGDGVLATENVTGAECRIAPSEEPYTCKSI
jgi:hypothetical protein